MKKLLIPAVIMLVVAAVAMPIMRRTPVDAGRLRLSGSIEATTLEISFKVPGRLARRFVDEGERVRRGQELGGLQTDEYREERNARMSDMKAAQAALDDLLAGSRTEEIAQGEAALSRLKAEAIRMSNEFDRVESLYNQEILPRNDLDAARAGRDSTAAAVREGEERLRLLMGGPRPFAVSQARAKVESAKAALAFAETRLSETSVFSPVDGVVMAKHAEPGEMLAAVAPILTVAVLDEVWLKGYIPETELGRVKVGQKVSITSDTWKGKVYEGRVTFISGQAEFTPKNVQTEKERVKLVYRVKIALPNPNGELKPGMPADAVIDTGAEQK